MSIAAVTSMLVGPVADLIGKFIPDKDQAAKLAHDIAIMAATLFYNVLAHPIASIWYEMPVVDPDLLYPVMLGILGIGGMNVAARTYEKVKGVTI
mgnify:CR=1 FL=1